ncbi:MAG: hypothetical protein K8I27_08235 [Planctomycetes bacterium]|nr:hypothetical protein [Planctomycetota bacterium]
MRRLFVPALLVLLVAPGVAQDTQTPRESFQKFIDAVQIKEATEEERTAAFDRYFDFDTWLANKQKSEDTIYTEDEQGALKADWYRVFRSAEFRRRYSENEVVIEESSVKGDKAELTLTIGKHTRVMQFRVLMKKSDDGTHWRWYDIPVVEGPLGPASRLKDLEKALTDLRLERARLNEVEQALLDEIARLRAELAEEGAGDSPYATPRSVVETAWRAIEANDPSALLDCHTGTRVTAADADSVRLNVQRTSERLMSWEILDSTIDTDDPGQAIVRVRVKLQRTGEPDDRTVNVRVVRAGDVWKIDEEP